MAKSSFEEGAEGSVSNKVAVQMARGARYKSGSNVSVAITGIAGPAAADSDKEVGRVHVAVIAEDFFLARRMISELMTGWTTKGPLLHSPLG